MASWHAFPIGARGILMTGRPANVPWLDPTFLENQRKFPADERQRYAGQHIAWSWDGTRILAGDLDRRALDEKLCAAGIDPGRVVHDYVEDADVSSQL
jgi:hypothetical protein